MTIYAVQVRKRTRSGRRAWVVLRAEAGMQRFEPMGMSSLTPYQDSVLSALAGLHDPRPVASIHDSTPDYATATGLAYDPKSGGLWADSVEHLAAELSRAEGRRINLRLIPEAAR